ncbi:hypothetical protein J7413_03985 [Shimia sp. R10_1]|uniref:hypothetical protein n=1 Tax=Shimia sp. R10_1 TaxID=2821095 RepID=UPI001ADD4A35|nr:hypothetical protein [Shimia sp. R10_1]MBO9472690.1 hypothetical protein [Shimia sp. R10_1]
MHAYFLKFHVKGEIAHTLLLSEPEPKLLVDISAEAARDSDAPGFRYPKRVSFTVRDQDLIERFRNSVAPGDVIEATGTFDQSGYVPHHKGHIDTTFELLDFVHSPAQADLKHAGRVFRTVQDARPN